MLVLLPPSETKRAGGDGPPLDLDALSFGGELNQVRKPLVDELVTLAADVPASRAALGLSPRQDDEVVRNAALWSAPTMPALHRYTGVLYDALDAGSLRGAAVDRTHRRLAIGSALFGLLMATDPVPAYRLSATSVLAGTLAARWRPVLVPVLAGFDDLVVDLRSGSYQALGPLPRAITVRILTEHADGRRTVVSHHNKSHKGRVARLLATTRAEPSTVDDVLRLLRRNGFRVERHGRGLDVIITE